MRNVCVLAPHEADSFARGQAINCAAHRHVSQKEARELTCEGASIYSHPVAQRLDHKRLVLKHRREWRKRPSAGAAIRQLVEI